MTIFQKHSQNPNRVKRMVFTGLAVLFPFLILILIEYTLRWVHCGGDLSLFVDAEAPYEAYLKINPDIGKRYFGRQSTLPKPANDVFLKQKPEHGYRIFVMGGSTALGFPYGNLLMFSRILHHRLQDTFPGKRIEVINTALTAANSWTLLDMLDEILDTEPDLILIYAGHNEYYGAMGVASLESPGDKRWLIKSRLFLNRFRFFQLLRNTIRKISAKGPRSGPNEGTLMERIAGKKSIPLDTPLYRAGLLQFEKNMRKVLSKTTQRKIPVLVGDLVCNLRDLTPFESLTLSESSRALSMYQSARDSENLDRYDQARIDYTRAKDMDCIRFRAPSELNDLIHNLAAAQNVWVVPVQNRFEKESPNGLTGNTLMTDHLHPNMEGCFLLADVYFETMKKAGLISSYWDETGLTSLHYRSTWPVTELDTTIVSLILKNLKSGWPFRSEKGEEPFLRRYRPVSLVEDLAIRVIRDEMTVGDAHLLLAKRYETTGDRSAANREYNVLTHLVFIEAYFYLWRAESYLRQGQESEAIKMLQKCLASEKIPAALNLLEKLSISE